MACLRFCETHPLNVYGTNSDTRYSTTHLCLFMMSVRYSLASLLTSWRYLTIFSRSLFLLWSVLIFTLWYYELPRIPICFNLPLLYAPIFLLSSSTFHSRGIPDLSPTSPLSVVTNISPASIIYCRTPPAGTASSVPQTNIYTVQTVLPKHTSPWKSGTNLDHFARRQRSITVLGYNGGSYTNSKTTRGCHQTI